MTTHAHSAASARQWPRSRQKIDAPRNVKPILNTTSMPNSPWFSIAAAIGFISSKGVNECAQSVKNRSARLRTQRMTNPWVTRLPRDPSPHQVASARRIFFLVPRPARLSRSDRPQHLAALIGTAQTHDVYDPRLWQTQCREPHQLT